MKTWTWLAPSVFYRGLSYLYPICGLVCLFSLVIGVWGSLAAPADAQQGNGFRILYVHVPCAVLSMILYASMAFAHGIYLVWHIKLADLVAKCLAKVGMIFCILSLLTGAIWGKPMWGTWWVWDARLTSELILCFLYWGILAIRTTIQQAQRAAKACAVVAIMGIVDLPIIHYSVNWWHTLHQGATLFSWQAPHIAPEMMWPLLFMLVSFFMVSMVLTILNLQAEMVMIYARLTPFTKIQSHEAI